MSLLSDAAHDDSQPTATVVVEARDLDTDERSRETFAVPVVSGRAQEQAQLAEATAVVHPSAKMRSFADGAATFLDRQHLIVAFYVERCSDVRIAERTSARSQERLFAY